MYKDVPIDIREFLFYLETIKNRSSNTVKEYYYDLRSIFRYLKKQKNNLDEDLNKIDILDIDINFIKTINLEDLYEYLGFLSINKSDKPSTRTRKISALKSFFNYLCQKKKKIDINPTIDLETPKLGKRIPKYLTLNESITLLQSIDGKFKKRDYAILTIFLNCGLRLSELVNINIKDINDKKIRIIGKGNKERELHLNDTCIKAINEYIKVRPKNGLKERDALFISNQGKRISPRMVELIVKKYIIAAGLNPKKFSPHKLRHTAATLMHKHAGIDIRALQQVLGHESISTTEIYTHIEDSQIIDAIDNNPLNKL